MTDQQTPFAAWVILELLGHRRLAGYLTEQQIAGHSFLRLDVPAPGRCTHCTGQSTPTDCQTCDRFGNLTAATQYYAPTSVYAITPTTEDLARQTAAIGQPAPIARWELPRPHDEENEPF